MKFKLLDIRLKKVYFSLNEKVISKADEGTEFEIKKDLGITIGRDDKNKNLLQIGLQIKNDDPDSPFNFDLIYEGFFKFESSEEISDEEIEKVGLINCAAIIFPYLREHLADLTRRSGLPPYHLPPINFVRLYKERSKTCGG